MISLVGKEKQEFRCPKCLRDVDKSWVLKYESEGYTRYLYLCSNCGYVFKIRQCEENTELLEHASIDEFPFSLDHT